MTYRTAAHGTPLSLSCLLALSLVAGCQADALYAYCTDSAQCGSRTYYEGDDEVTVPIDCVEAQVSVDAERTTHGSFCSIECLGPEDCEGRVGLPDGLCIAWSGDEAFHCYQPCARAEDCYESSSCEEVTVDGAPTRVCLPTRL